MKKKYIGFTLAIVTLLLIGCMIIAGCGKESGGYNPDYSVDC